MPLTLVTGPANSEKAGHVLDSYRARIDRAPLLVVPTGADVAYYRRELAAAGPVAGVRVERFNGLIADAAARAGVDGAPLGPTARRRVAAAAIATTDLQALAEPARGGGFVGAAVDLFAQLEAARIDPPRLTQALRAWAGDGPRRAYADDVAAIYAAYRRALERLGRSDAELHTRAVLDALRQRPALWRATPVLFYGFDDFTAMELDAIETLAKIVDAPVTVSLPFEAGRLAFAGRATTFETLNAIADDHLVLPPLETHYAASARGALSHLERALFGASETANAPRPPAGDALQLVEGGGERDELELVADAISELLRGGYAASDIAVVLRAPTAVAPLIDEVFGAAAIPYALARRLRFGDTALGRGAIALLRAALLDGGADELIAWLRTPGMVERPALVDALEAQVRRDGLDVDAALARWQELHWPLEAVDRLRAARRGRPRELLAATTTELERLFARPRRRAAAVLDGLERDDARALAGAQRGLRELGDLAQANPRLAPRPEELIAALAELELVAGADEDVDAVLVTDPLALRARRVRVVIACRLQEGVFPQRRRPPPFFSERQRAEIATATGLVLPPEPNWLAVERYLFYAAVSRPYERLLLSWHLADDDGQPVQRSLFVDDVCDLFAPELLASRIRRQPAPAVAATADPAQPPGQLHNDAVLAYLRGRGAWSPSSLEAWSRCPVKWLIERHIGADDLDPEAEPLIRGRFVHELLRATFTALAERRGSARIDDEPALISARAVLTAAIDELAPRYRLSLNPERFTAALEEVRLDLERYFDQCLKWGGTYEPRHFELEFGYGEAGRTGDPDADTPEHALALAGGRIALHGRIDRVDVDPESKRAIVYDYKGRSVDKPDDWLAHRTLQLPLYMLAARELLGIDPVGGFYQPIGARPDDRRARGVLADGADDTIDCVRGDRRDPDEVRELLDAVVALAVTAIEELEAGLLEPRPRTCGYDGHCAYPSICRLEAT